MTKETVISNIVSSAVSLAERSLGFHAVRQVIQNPPEEDKGVTYPLAAIIGGSQFIFPATTSYMFEGDGIPSLGRLFGSSMAFSWDISTNGAIFALFHNNLTEMLAWRLGTNLITQISMDTIYVLATKTRSLVKKQ